MRALIMGVVFLALLTSCAGETRPESIGVSIQTVASIPTATATTVPTPQLVFDQILCSRRISHSGPNWELLCADVPGGWLEALIISGDDLATVRRARKDFGEWALKLSIGNPCTARMNIFYPTPLLRLLDETIAGD